MLSIIGSIFSFVGGFVPAVTAWATAKTNVSGQEFQTAATTDEQAYASANMAKVAVAASLAGTIMMLAFGLPTAVHWGWTMITATFPQWGYHTDPLSGQYVASEHDIAMSFFVVAPVTTALAVWSRR